MTDGTIGIRESSSPDKLLDSEQLSVGLNTVQRERQRVAGSGATELAEVKNASPSADAYGLVVRDTNVLTPFRDPAVMNTAVAVKASAGALGSYHIQNPGSANAYLQLYDLAAGSVVVGTTTPVQTWWVPAGGALDGELVRPLSFAAAITIAATTTPTGGTAPATALLVNLGYA